MKEIPIGGEIRIRCVEGNDCDKCIFRNDNCITIRKICDFQTRTDYKDVHFELVENPEPIELLTDEEISAYSSMFYTGSAIHYIREGMRIMKNWIKKELNPEPPKEDTK